jgi:hypothetical protein
MSSHKDRSPLTEQQRRLALLRERQERAAARQRLQRDTQRQSAVGHRHRAR